MDLVTKQELLNELRLSERALESWVSSGRFPAPVRIGRRAYWSRAAIEHWKELTFAYQLQFRPS